MADSREFYVIDLGNMVDSSKSISAKLNAEIERFVPKGRGVHYLESVSHDGHVYVFLRGYDGGTGAGPAARKRRGDDAGGAK